MPNQLTRRNLALAVGAGASLVFLAAVSRQVVLTRGVVPAWVEPQYWLTYDRGFVRRGLPGAILEVLSPGPTTRSEALVCGVLTSVSAAGLLGLLAWRTVRPLVHPTERWLAFVALAATGLTCGLPLQDLARYDAWGVIATVLLSLSRFRSLRTAVPLVMLATVIATATEEFLLVLVMPVAVAVIFRVARTEGRQPFRWAISAVLPALAIALLSLALRVPSSAQTLAIARARAQGAQLVAQNAVSILNLSVTQTAREFISPIPTATFISFLVPLVVESVLLLLALRRLSAGVSQRVFAALCVLSGVATAALCLVGVDYRRWFALGVVSLWAAVYQLRTESHPIPAAEVSDGRWILGTPLLASLLVLGPTTQLMTVFLYWNSRGQEAVVELGTALAVVLGCFLLLKGRRRSGTLDRRLPALQSSTGGGRA